ncbi:hypothetical protein [Desulfovibrio sp.]|uniref:hypothetical protein n=1 Tax=Desulfovibrio sp. TaxID=885 RepID=UPI0025BEF5D3|nr:hypothetical protein [Desulfovibrio sp.]
MSGDTNGKRSLPSHAGTSLATDQANTTAQMYLHYSGALPSPLNHKPDIESDEFYRHRHALCIAFSPDHTVWTGHRFFNKRY